MCLVVIAHRASSRYPLVIAANRDEEYARASNPAGWWDDGEVVGGRDALHGGSWLAMSTSGRFAAVTNLRGAVKPAAGQSRGALVSEFVRGNADTRSYADAIDVDAYGGFHLFLGRVGVDLAQLSGVVRPLEPGIHGLSNAPAEVVWPKVTTAIETMRGALESASATVMAESLMRLLRLEPTHGDPTRDLFIRGERYGTRASTVIIVDGRDVRFVEQNFAPRGVALGERITVEFSLG
ncbi:MAG TPA: NRDE family protein [Thermoanaerobaculia bacterium]